MSEMLPVVFIKGHAQDYKDADLYDISETFECYEDSFEKVEKYYSEAELQEIQAELEERFKQRLEARLLEQREADALIYFNALDCAMQICDTTPTHLQEHEDSQVSGIGKLVNEHGYYQIINSAYEKAKENINATIEEG